LNCGEQMSGIDYLSVGKILGPWGLKGEVRLFPYTDYPERFSYLKRAFIFDGEFRREVVAESARQQNNIIIIKFRDFNSISEVEKLAGLSLQVSREDAVKLPPDVYFICDILGADIYTVEGEFVGVLKDVLQLGAQDVYVIDTPDNKEVLIPAVKQFIKSVDLKANLITIQPIKGMLSDED
jgi:16S rRNA processing protein RimM